MSLYFFLTALAGLHGVVAQVWRVGWQLAYLFLGPPQLISTKGACSIEAGTQFTNADIAVIYNIADAQSCCQFCQGFSTISAVPCGGYSFCASCPDGKANICALKGPGTMSNASSAAYTSGEVVVVRNFSSNVVVPPPAQNGSCQIMSPRYLWDRSPYPDECRAEYLENKLNVGSAQDCCSYCTANSKCNMFDWCDPALAATADGQKCNPGGLNGGGLPGDCTMWRVVKATEAFQKCTVNPDGAGTWSAGIIEGRDPPPESRRLRLRL